MLAFNSDCNLAMRRQRLVMNGSLACRDGAEAFWNSSLGLTEDSQFYSQGKTMLCDLTIWVKYCMMKLHMYAQTHRQTQCQARRMLTLFYYFYYLITTWSAFNCFQHLPDCTLRPTWLALGAIFPQCLHRRHKNRRVFHQKSSFQSYYELNT